MKFLVLVGATPQSEAGELPTPEMMAKMGEFNQQLAKAGVMLAAEGLHPTSRGARMSFAGPKPVVTDGPFTETKELVAGFWIWEVKSKDEALEWLSRCPFERGEQVELRQIYSPEEFAAILEQIRA